MKAREAALRSLKEAIEGKDTLASDISEVNDGRITRLEATTLSGEKVVVGFVNPIEIEQNPKILSYVR